MTKKGALLIPNYNKKKSRKKGLTIEQTLSEGGIMPNMSRRSPSNVLLVFPNFDKCDSLLYFPSTMTKHMNSGDIDAISKLLSSHLDKDCIIKFSCGIDYEVSQKTFMRLIDISDDLEPDRIMCVHSTKVIENQIKATVYMKLTDSQELYNLMSGVLQNEPDLSTVCVADRAGRFSLYAKDTSLTDHKKQELLMYSNSCADLLLYIQCDMIMTFDDFTKKVVDIGFTYILTSVHPMTTT